MRDRLRAFIGERTGYWMCRNQIGEIVNMVLEAITPESELDEARQEGFRDAIEAAAGLCDAEAEECGYDAKCEDLTHEERDEAAASQATATELADAIRAIAPKATP